MILQSVCTGAIAQAFWGPTDLIADMVALPDHGGQFPVADFVGPELAAYANAEAPACDEQSLTKQLLAA